jgi:gamma-glutamylcyclotransferase (GGCT)/AIG2-like uncharacterized protein YtfP
VGTRALFAYGTLEIPAVMLAVTARSFASEPARLDGFVRFLLRDRAYPGIVETPGATTEGRVYHGVDDASLARLDRFEDDCYERRGVVVRRADGSCLAADAYVIPLARRALLGSEPWRRERFEREALAGFLADCERFRSDAAEPRRG